MLVHSCRSLVSRSALIPLYSIFLPELAAFELLFLPSFLQAIISCRNIIIRSVVLKIRIEKDLIEFIIEAQRYKITNHFDFPIAIRILINR